MQPKKNLLYPPLAGNSEHIHANFSKNIQQKSPNGIPNTDKNGDWSQ